MDSDLSWVNGKSGR